MRAARALAPVRPTAWPAALGGLAVAIAALGAAFHTTWASITSVWWGSTTYHHGFLVAPISLWLAWQRRQDLAGHTPCQEPMALLPLAGFATLWLLGEAGDAQILQHVGVVGMLASTVVALLGRPVCRALAFPLAFLFFMVPFGDFLIPSLQDLTARFAVALLRVAGVPVFHDGVLIETSSGLFEVAEACAGVRFLIANVMIAALFAHFAYRRAWKVAAFMSLALTVPVVANGLRAFGIVYIAFWTDNKYASGVDHVVYGWGFFSAIMLLLLLVGRTFADSGPHRASAVPPEGLEAVPQWRPIFVLLVLAFLLAAPAYGRVAMTSSAGAALLPPPPSLAVNTRWSRLPTAADWRPVMANPDLEMSQAYARGDQGQGTVDFYLGYYAFQRPGAEVVYHANQLADGKRWVRASGGWQPLAITGLPARVQRERLTGDGRERLVLAWYWVGGTFTADARYAKLLQCRDRLLGRARPAAILAVSTLVEDSPEEALARLEGFLGDGFVPAPLLATLATGGGSGAGEPAS